ncbi:fumarate reductase (CoM/CoB) subunit TfrB [Methanoregula sp.]|uniref:fumarate reductase (CoM/CoB) subunit TfrB n=1 Tax=Methanoregula sp. TaxID=2052170 RepID=UPI002BD33F04|nr:fumarate reductase (CoM/CoB) subunit TfrB [Methanoregula sp.]HVP96404.1 fumarate reductase (CoM/CoB) subunit TfrB [Methanoregula sp.]
MKEIRVAVLRFDPKKDPAPHPESYTVRVNEGARVLHVLHAIHDEIDPTLSYRYCCGSGQCGSCAVQVNGEPVLACMKEAAEGITIAPLNLPVKKDLVVDLLPKIATIASLVPPEGEAPLPTKAQIDEIKPLRDCIECMACVSVCPAMDVTTFLGPTAMRQEMRLALDPRDTINRVPDAIRDGLFTCTSCQACYKACPKKIQIPGKAIEKLRALANRQGFTLPRHREVEALIKETGRSVVRTAPSFMEQVGTTIEPYGPVRATVGFFVGCMYNLRQQQSALDAIEILKRNGIRVIIPRDQICCGSPLIRTGQLDYLDTLRKRNIDAFRTRGIDTVMTMCAGCGSTLKHDYVTPFKVIDINELLTHYGIEPPAKLPLRATYHDPCHLLRGQDVKDEPRQLIRQVVDLVEMPAICCGSGGGVKSGLPDEAAALGEKRREEIRKTGADIVITSCPFCEFHIASHSDKPVKNIMTVLLEGYREKDRQEQKKE